MIRELFTFSPHPTNIDKVRVSVKCCDCKGMHRFDIHEEEWFVGLAALSNGYLMQDAFPNLDPDNREALISRLCPNCFDSICHD